MSIGEVASIAQIASVIGGVAIGFWKIWRKIDQHQSNSEARSMVVETRLDRIEQQFGPNGGGLREAVNRIGEAVSKIDSKLDGVSVEVAQLKGEFHQHIKESK